MSLCKCLREYARVYISVFEEERDIHNSHCKRPDRYARTTNSPVRKRFLFLFDLSFVRTQTNERAKLIP